MKGRCICAKTYIERSGIGKQFILSLSVDASLRVFIVGRLVQRLDYMGHVLKKVVELEDRNKVDQGSHGTRSALDLDRS